MERLNKKYFICEEGHITVGEKTPKKCEAIGYLLEYTKGKRKGKWEIKEKEEKKCGKGIVKEGEIPDRLDLTTVWDHETMHAFLIDQKIDADFMIELQKSITDINNRIILLEKKYAQK